MKPNGMALVAATWVVAAAQEGAMPIESTATWHAPVGNPKDAAFRNPMGLLNSSQCDFPTCAPRCLKCEVRVGGCWMTGKCDQDTYGPSQCVNGACMCTGSLCAGLLGSVKTCVPRTCLKGGEPPPDPEVTPWMEFFLAMPHNLDRPPRGSSVWNWATFYDSCMDSGPSMLLLGGLTFTFWTVYIMIWGGLLFPNIVCQPKKKTPPCLLWCWGLITIAVIVLGICLRFQSTENTLYIIDGQYQHLRRNLYEANDVAVHMNRTVNNMLTTLYNVPPSCIEPFGSAVVQQAASKLTTMATASITTVQGLIITFASVTDTMRGGSAQVRIVQKFGSKFWQYIALVPMLSTACAVALVLMGACGIWWTGTGYLDWMLEAAEVRGKFRSNAFPCCPCGAVIRVRPRPVRCLSFCVGFLMLFSCTFAALNLGLGTGASNFCYRLDENMAGILEHTYGRTSSAYEIANYYIRGGSQNPIAQQVQALRVLVTDFNATYDDDNFGISTASVICKSLGHDLKVRENLEDVLHSIETLYGLFYATNFWRFYYWIFHQGMCGPLLNGFGWMFLFNTIIAFVCLPIFGCLARRSWHTERELEIGTVGQTDKLKTRAAILSDSDDPSDDADI